MNDRMELIRPSSNSAKPAAVDDDGLSEDGNAQQPSSFSYHATRDDDVEEEEEEEHQKQNEEETDLPPGWSKEMIADDSEFFWHMRSGMTSTTYPPHQTEINVEINEMKESEEEKIKTENLTEDRKKKKQKAVYMSTPSTPRTLDGATTERNGQQMEKFKRLLRRQMFERQLNEINRLGDKELLRGIIVNYHETRPRTKDEQHEDEDEDDDDDEFKFVPQKKEKMDRLEAKFIQAKEQLATIDYYQSLLRQQVLRGHLVEFNSSKEKVHLLRKAMKKYDRLNGTTFHFYDDNEQLDSASHQITDDFDNLLFEINSLDDPDDYSRRQTLRAVRKFLRFHVDYARDLADRLRPNEVSLPILAMDKKTMAEIRSYANPKPIVHLIMQAALLLLGEDEAKTTMWGNCKSACIPDGRNGLNRRLMKFDVKDLNDFILRRCRQVLRSTSLEEVQKASPGAATFYVWAAGVLKARDYSIDDEMDEYDEEMKKMKMKEIIEMEQIIFDNKRLLLRSTAPAAAAAAAAAAYHDTINEQSKPRRRQYNVY